MLENKLKVITTTTQVKSNGVKKDSAVLVYKNKKGYEVHAVISRDVAYFRVSANVYIKTPDGRKSRYTTIQKSDVVCEKKNAFNYLLGLEGEFTNDDVNKIRRKMKEILSSDSEFVDEGEVFTPEELYQAVCDYIRENAMDKKTHPDTNVFIKGEYGFLNKEKMKEFAKDVEGYTFQEIRRTLKFEGAFATSKDREYDYQEGSSKKRYYRIIMLPEMEEKED